MRRIPQVSRTATSLHVRSVAKTLRAPSSLVITKHTSATNTPASNARVSETLAAINRAHGGDVPAAFERAVRIAGERRQFWSRFCDVPDVYI